MNYLKAYDITIVAKNKCPKNELIERSPGTFVAQHKMYKNYRITCSAIFNISLDTTGT